MFSRESRLSRRSSEGPLSATNAAGNTPGTTKDRKQTPHKPSALSTGKTARRRDHPHAQSLSGLHTPPCGQPRSASKASSPRTPSEMSEADTTSTVQPQSPPSEDNIQVVVRVKPMPSAARGEGSLEVVSPACIRMASNQGPRSWTFDHIAGPETSQEAFFAVAGSPFVEHCLDGFHASIFAYGQTSSGKTHTMTGKLDSPAEMGLSMRVMQQLLQRISAAENSQGRQRYQLRASYLELYDEQITDLLAPASAAQLTIREDVCSESAKVYVEGLTEVELLNEHNARRLMERGMARRRTNETRMNAESSRSHAVLTLHLESSARTDSGLLAVRSSRLNLIDLAGSERNKSSFAAGDRLKEACTINQSLTTLGRVIKLLVEAQRSRLQRHIPYRDSRLTFLLQESLGGNAKTMIIANVSPAEEHAAETASTLAFASCAKCIRNSAVVNQDVRGDAELMRRELERLQRENDMLRQQSSAAGMRGAAAGAAPSCLRGEDGSARLSNELLQKAEERMVLLSRELAEEISRNEQERQNAERRIQHLESSSSATRQELNAARLAGIADRQADGCQISSLKAQVREQSVHIAALEGNLTKLQQALSEHSHHMQQQLSTVQQELHDAELAASVAQDQLAHERQRTGRLKHAIKSAFEEARTPAAGIAGHGWLHGDNGHLQKENTPSPQHMHAGSPGRKAFQGLHVNVDV